MRISKLPRESVFYILDRLIEEYPEDVEAWLKELLGEEVP